MPPLQSFPALTGNQPRVLILGSMPGAASLAAGQYYAHRQNRFWPLMGTLVGAGPDLPYEQRCRRLVGSGIALWDVLASCERQGSLDSAIRDETARANDFGALFSRHPTIKMVLFNGGKAEASFHRLVVPGLVEAGGSAEALQYRRLPSTSPANASQSAEHKLSAWRAALQAVAIPTTR